MNFDNSGARNKRAARVLPLSADCSATPSAKKLSGREIGKQPRIQPNHCCKGQRKAGGSRFFSILSDEQMRASEMIARGFHLRTTGLGMRTQSFSWQPKSTGSADDRQLDLMRRFTVWAVAVQRKGLSLAAVLDIIVFEKSCRTVDRERKKRNGFARSQLLESLDLYRKI